MVEKNESVKNISILNESLDASNKSLFFNLTNISLNVSNKSVPLNLTNISLNVSNESILEENLNESNDSLILKVFNFVVSSFIEGGVFSFNWFEMLSSVGIFSGDEYVGKFFVDSVMTPNIEARGTYYSASVGSFGLLATPFSEKNYCGNGVCDEGENCLSCSVDCGECSGSSGGSSGSGGCNYNESFDWKCSEWGICYNGFQSRKCLEKNNCGNKVGRPDVVRNCSVVDNESTKAEENNIFVELIDVDMNLELDVLERSQDLMAVFYYNLRGIPVFINLTFEVYSSDGVIVYSSREDHVVKESEIWNHKFKDLNLKNGDYRLVSRVFYNEEIKVFKNEFRVEKKISFISGNVVGKITRTEGSWIIGVIVFVIIIFSLWFWINGEKRRINRIAKKIKYYDSLEDKERLGRIDARRKRILKNLEIKI